MPLPRLCHGSATCNQQIYVEQPNQKDDIPTETLEKTSTVGWDHGSRDKDAHVLPSPRTPSHADEHGEERWFQRNVKWRIEALYRFYVVELLLRQKPLPSSKDGRHIPFDRAHPGPYVDERRGHTYISNSIRSSRYTIYDFLPKQILFQCTRLSNFYFICIGVPQTIPGISPTGSFTTILPVIFFLSLTILKEGYDDYRRHRMDKVENKSVATVLREVGDDSRPIHSRMARSLRSCFSQANSCPDEVEEAATGASWISIQWRDIRVGDVIRLNRDETVPADIVLLSASGDNAIAYVETMALDGETNLKRKQALSIFKDCSSISGIESCRAEFVIEDPNPNLYAFEGRVSMGGEIYPLTLNEVIYRGSVLRNTTFAVGLVLNTGEECKIRMNANHHPKAKKPRLEKYANQVVLALIVYVVSLSIGCSLGYVLWAASTQRHSWYLAHARVSLRNIIIGFIIEFNNVIPLALYISLEIVKLGQMFLIHNDIEMYDETTDTPMRCSTNTILENLGQVDFVLSDKTGTLTENIMKFRQMSISGTVFTHQPATHEDRVLEVKQHQKASHSSDQKVSIKVGANPSHSEATSQSMNASTFLPSQMQHILTTDDLLQYMQRHPTAAVSREARNFILIMALCNTCVPEVRDGCVQYQGSSPDEVALIDAAKDLGCEVTDRTLSAITLSFREEDSKTRQEVYKILDVIEFSSKRKRMSIIVRCPDERIWLLCKGADGAILPRLRQSSVAAQAATQVHQSLEIERQLQRRSESREVSSFTASRPNLLAGTNHEVINEKLSIEFRSSPSTVPGTNVVMSPESRIEYANHLIGNSSIFSTCFKHIDDFATEGLRTLVFAHRYIAGEEYAAWKKTYQDAITSLEDRQGMTERAAELIEQSLELLGASAIEDKLQVGVPETIDKLRRANIRVWMLTGDKRETAINVAHAARICKPDSDIFVLDIKSGDLRGQLRAVAEEIAVDELHSVIVVDGNTLLAVDADPGLKRAFYSLIPIAPSVICCRTSPAQKAAIVKAIKTEVPGALTLAIGDGANDVAMIQTSHVGVGISGREGLQASRVADFSISQFRFLQRLLLVHGRWNYVRTAKFIMMTFWKEMFFYMPQVVYQRYNGYTGTSLYENWSLTVLNTFFTSLCVVIMGIFEQDLSASTLLEWPERYVYGQQNMGLNIRKYLAWMLLAAIEGMIVWFIAWAAYGSSDRMGDQGLFAIGDLVFGTAIIWTNWKLFFLQTRYKTVIVYSSFTITFAGWWAWNLFLSAVYTPFPGEYAAHKAFTHLFGRDPIWWLTIVLTVGALAMAELAFSMISPSLAAVGGRAFERRHGPISIHP